jgi:DNA-binding transcriptional LysR family regulator
VIPEGINKHLHSQERYGLFCGRGHPLFGDDDVDIGALRGEPYVSFTADVLGGEHMGPVTAVRAFASFGQWVRAASPNVEEVTRLILTNVGIGMLPVHLAGPLVARGHLWQLPPYTDLPTTKTWLIWNPAATLNPAEAAFLKACLAVPVVKHF